MISNVRYIYIYPPTPSPSSRGRRDISADPLAKLEGEARGKDNAKAWPSRFSRKLTCTCQCQSLNLRPKTRPKTASSHPLGLESCWRCCTAPLLGMHLAHLGLEFCWGSTGLQACLTDAFIGHVHLRAYVQLSAMRLLYARFCFVFTGFEDAVRHRLWGSIWHALGSNSAGVPLFRKHASRTRSSAMSTYVPLCPAIRHTPIYIHAFVHAFAVFLRVSKMLYGTASGDEFGTPWARILLGFRCFASMPHGCDHRPCPPAMRLCPALRHAPINNMHAFALCLRVSKMLYGTASGDEFGTPWVWILLGFRCFASMPHGRMHRPSTYAPICLSAMRLYIHAFVHAFAVFLRVWKIYMAPPLGMNLARLGLEFCWGSAVAQACLTDAFIGHVHLRAYMSSYPPCAYISMLLSMLLLCFYGFRRCCTAPPLGMNLARLGLEFCWGSAVSQACLTDAFIGHVHLPCLYVQLSAMRLLIIALCLRVSKMLYGTASKNLVTCRLAPLANNMSDLRIVAHAHPTLLFLLLGVGGMGGSR